MSSHLIQGKPNAVSGVPTVDMKPITRPVTQNALWDLLKPIASLRLTVFLFVLSLILVFFGTLAQMNNGIWTVVKQYFRWWYVWIDLQLAVQFAQIFFGVSEKLKIPGSFPFPGGWTIGSLLLVNLVAAHLVRFKLSWKRSGIIIIHSGIILMMVGELVTGLYAVEGNMVIGKGQSSSNLVDGRHSEVAIIDRGDAEYDKVVVIPDAILKEEGLIQNDKLPFDVRVEKYMNNSAFADKKPDNFVNPANAGLGVDETVVERPENPGTDSNNKYDRPSAYVTFFEKGSDKSLGTYLVSLHFSGEIGDAGLQTVKVAGKSYEVGLRFKRTHKDYNLYLKDFNHAVYTGTIVAKDFRSTILLSDPSNEVKDREIEIYMNHPLRYRGETFYQSGVLDGDAGTILQVVRNPGWLLPYFSCFLVTMGMIVHFGMSLNTFLERAGVSDRQLKERSQRIRRLFGMTGGNGT